MSRFFITVFRLKFKVQNSKWSVWRIRAFIRTSLC